MKISDFKNCPRCNLGDFLFEENPIKLFKAECEGCGILGTESAIYYKFNTGALYWILKSETCDFLYASTSKFVRLPWLPFDISEDRLKQLIVFL